VKLPIEDKAGVLACLYVRLHLMQVTIAHCKSHGETDEQLANNLREECRMLEAIRFIEENAAP
jgi:hypothetical protein